MASSVLSALSRRHKPHTPLVKGLPGGSGAITAEGWAHDERATGGDLKRCDDGPVCSG